MKIPMLCFFLFFFFFFGGFRLDLFGGLMLLTCRLLCDMGNNLGILAHMIRTKHNKNMH